MVEKPLKVKEKSGSILFHNEKAGYENICSVRKITIKSPAIHARNPFRL